MKVKKLRRAEKRKWSLIYLTNIVGREGKQLLTHIYTINKDSSKSTLCKRNKVEVALINQNLKYFKKVMLMKAYHDKIYK